MPKLNEFTTRTQESPEEFNAWQDNPSEDNYKNLLKKLDPIIKSV